MVADNLLPEFSEGVSLPDMFVDKAGRILFTWDNPHISAEVEHVALNDKGLRAEMSVMNGRRTLMPHTFVNFSSTRGRSEIRNALNGAMALEDWDDRIKHVATEVRKALLKSTEGGWLGTGEAPPEAQYLNPLIEVGRPTVLQAAGGTGKSRFALAMAMDIAEEINLIPGVKAQQNGPVLYLDFEADKATQERRYRSLIDGVYGTPKNKVRYERMSGSLPAQIDTISRWVSEHEYQLVIVDSLSWAAGGSLNDDDVATNFFSVLRQIPCATLLIAHVRKNNENGMPFGSVFWWNGARNVFELQLDQSAGLARADISLHHLKGNDMFLQDSLAWTVTTQEGRCYYVNKNVADTPKFAAKLPIWQLCGQAVAEGYSLSSDIAKRVSELKGQEVTADHCRTEMNRHKDMFERNGDLWNFTAKGDEWARNKFTDVSRCFADVSANVSRGGSELAKHVSGDVSANVSATQGEFNKPLAKHVSVQKNQTRETKDSPAPTGLGGESKDRNKDKDLYFSDSRANRDKGKDRLDEEMEPLPWE